MSSSSSEMRSIGSGVGLLAGAACVWGGGRKTVPAGAKREPNRVCCSFGWNGDEAGTSITLAAGDEDLTIASPGRLSTCVGCVVSPSLRKTDGEHGIVSPASSSMSSCGRPCLREGVRGTMPNCESGGSGDELRAMTKREREKRITESSGKRGVERGCFMKADEQISEESDSPLFEK